MEQKKKGYDGKGVEVIKISTCMDIIDIPTSIRSSCLQKRSMFVSIER